MMFLRPLTAASSAAAVHSQARHIATATSHHQRTASAALSAAMISMARMSQPLAASKPRSILAIRRSSSTTASPSSTISTSADSITTKTQPTNPSNPSDLQKLSESQHTDTTQPLLYPIPPPTVNQNGRGLLDFFETEKGWAWKENEPKTGRAWTCAELRTKHFEDLHKLWWVCIKEVNKLLSQRDEARNFKVIFPHKIRLRQVRITMRNIKIVIWERRIAYLQAKEIVDREVWRNEQLDALAKEHAAAATTSTSSNSTEVNTSSPTTEDPTIEKWMYEKVDKMMAKKYPIPISAIGRPRAMKEIHGKQKTEQKDKAKGRKKRTNGHRAKRWYVV